jgi:hypothetical protein
MVFNEHQLRLWRGMLKSIESFRKDELLYRKLVYGLEGALDAGEFKDQNLIKQWYDFWTPLEILYATKGNSVTIEDTCKYLFDMESFLKRILLEALTTVS